MNVPEALVTYLNTPEDNINIKDNQVQDFRSRRRVARRKEMYTGVIYKAEFVSSEIVFTH